jgi:hypothetical protein
MEPQEALYRYALEGNEGSLLKYVSEVYQKRIKTNKKELRWMFFAGLAANVCAALGIIWRRNDFAKRIWKCSLCGCLALVAFNATYSHAQCGSSTL